MAITDLTGCTWSPNATIEFPNEITYSINYNIVCANTEYNSTGGTTLVFMVRSFRTYTFYSLDIDTSNYSAFSGAIFPSTGTIFEGSDSSTMSVTNGTSPTYVTEIQFTGGTDATNSNLISWLEANGTLTAPIVANTYNITHTLTNIEKGNISLQLTADSGYELPDTITVTNGTLISYNKSTGIAVINGDNTTNVSVECVAPSGYSGNITRESQYGAATVTYIKFGSSPTNDSDYDSLVDPGGIIDGSTSYTNQTKVYIWGNGGVRINGMETWCPSTSYSNAIEITLTGNYDIIMFYGPPIGGGGAAI